MRRGFFFHLNTLKKMTNKNKRKGEKVKLWVNDFVGSIETSNCSINCDFSLIFLFFALLSNTLLINRKT